LASRARPWHLDPPSPLGRAPMAHVRSRQGGRPAAGIVRLPRAREYVCGRLVGRPAAKQLSPGTSVEFQCTTRAVGSFPGRFGGGNVKAGCLFLSTSRWKGHSWKSGCRTEAYQGPSSPSRTRYFSSFLFQGGGARHQGRKPSVPGTEPKKTPKRAARTPGPEISVGSQRFLQGPGAARIPSPGRNHDVVGRSVPAGPPEQAGARGLFPVRVRPAGTPSRSDHRQPPRSGGPELVPVRVACFFQANQEAVSVLPATGFERVPLRREKAMPTFRCARVYSSQGQKDGLPAGFFNPVCPGT